MALRQSFSLVLCKKLVTAPQFRLYCYREPLCGCVCLIIALLWLMSLLFAGTKQWFAEPKL